MSNHFIQSNHLGHFLNNPIFIFIGGMIITIWLSYLMSFPAIPQWYINDFEKEIRTEYEANGIIVNLTVYDPKFFSDDYTAILKIYKSGGEEWYDSRNEYRFLWSLRNDVYKQVEDYLKVDNKPSPLMSEIKY